MGCWWWIGWGGCGEVGLGGVGMSRYTHSNRGPVNKRGTIGLQVYTQLRACGLGGWDLELPLPWKIQAGWDGVKEGKFLRDEESIRHQ